MADSNRSHGPELKATLTKTVISGPKANLHLYLASVLAGSFLLGWLFPTSEKYFALIPANTAMVKAYVWNIFTAAYFETSFIMAILNTSVAFIVGRMLERKWGIEFLKLMAIVNMAAMFMTFIFMVACYASTMTESYIFTPICGFSAANAAFGVALKQLAPEQNCIASVNQLKFKHLPSITVCCAFGCYIFGLTDIKDLLLVVFGTYFGWLYLRYFMPYPGSSQRGDGSEEFAFKTMWPGYSRPIGAMFGNLAFCLCSSCGFCKVVDTPVDIELGAKPIITTSIPDVPEERSEAERQMAERRRQLAFKAINERLEQLKKQQSTKKKAAVPKSEIQAKKQDEN